MGSFEEKEDITLLDLVFIGKNWIVLISGLIIFAVIALSISLILGLLNPVTYIYGARTTIEFIPDEQMEKQDQVIIAIMSSDGVVDAALTKLKITTGISNIKSNISVKASSINNQIDIVAYHSDENNARDIANEIRRQGTNLASSAISYEGLTFVEEAVQLEKPITIGNSPKYFLNTVIGAILGLVVAISYIFVYKILNQKISTERDVKRFTGKQVLVSIPNTSIKKRKFYEVT